MSHHHSHPQPTPSAPGTPLPDRTVGELVAERPGRSRVFQSFQIDFCCQGSRTLREACERKGVALASVVDALESESSAPAPAANPATLPPADLADYIVREHHAFLRRELPRLHAMADRVARVHGGHTPSLVEVFQVFTGLEAELIHHLEKEEVVLFPAIRDMAGRASDGPPLEIPVACMIHEHEEAGAALRRLRELTHDFTPPADACNTYRALFAGLADLETDTHRHIHLENTVLFPAALQPRDAASPATA